MQRIVDLVEHQVIAAVRSEEDMLTAAESVANVIFLLAGTIVNLGRMMDIARTGGKHVFLHLEFMEGIAADKSGMKYIAQSIKPAGVISTRSHAIVMAKDNGLLAVQRLFLIDSTAIRNGIKSIHSSGADAVEVMPGVIPHMISELTDLTPLPIFAGGLVRNREEIDKALEAGALAVSVGDPHLWKN
jgi:glycerol uptake operon antiterminator